MNPRLGLSLVVALVLVTSVVVLVIKSRCRMMPLPEYDVYVINLDRARDRLHRFKKRYGVCDVAATRQLIRYPAVDGRRVNMAEHLTDKALYEVLRAEREGHRTKHYQLTRGGVGCYLSHVSLWRDILESDKDAALIFEDDAIMAKNIGGIMRRLHVPVDADIVLLGYYCNKCNNTACGVVRVRRFFGLHGYVITRRGIEKIMAHPDVWSIGKQIDSWLTDLARDGTLNLYATPEQYVVQDHTLKTSIQMVLKPPKGSDPWSE